MTPLSEWERCKPWIEAALEYDGGFYKIEHVREEIEAKRALLWVGKKSAVVCQLWHFPTGTALHYWLAGGDLDELLNDMRPVIEQRAKDAGCVSIILAGRRGWERAMKPLGYLPIWTALKKNLT